MLLFADTASENSHKLVEVRNLHGLQWETTKTHLPVKDYGQKKEVSSHCVSGRLRSVSLNAYNFSSLTHYQTYNVWC